MSFDMNEERIGGTPKDFMGVKWRPMLVMSILFHLAVFSLILFLPESMSTTKRFEGIVYEVDLVELPRGGEPKQGKAADTADVKKAEAKTVVKTDTTAKRISGPSQKEKPVVISKLTVQKESKQKEKPKISSSELIDKAISKLETRVKAESKDQAHIDQAISKIEGKVSRTGTAPEGTETGTPGGGVIGGIAMRIYQVEAESWIKSNWSYPVGVGEARTLEAVVVLMVKRDGTIQNTQFKTRSSNALFDESVSKAIERSNPLPPFPESYRKDNEEFEITFNLKDLENG
jgi:colicin import membrane protein